MIPTALSGGITHYRQGTVVAKIALPLGLGCVVGSFIGGQLGDKVNDVYLKYGFTGLMIFLGVKTLSSVRKIKKI
jgi:uncharacterized membrane protein YfcA